MDSAEIIWLLRFPSSYSPVDYFSTSFMTFLPLFFKNISLPGSTSTFILETHVKPVSPLDIIAQVGEALVSF